MAEGVAEEGECGLTEWILEESRQIPLPNEFREAPYLDNTFCHKCKRRIVASDVEPDSNKQETVTSKVIFHAPRGNDSTEFCEECWDEIQVIMENPVSFYSEEGEKALCTHCRRLREGVFRFYNGPVLTYIGVQLCKPCLVFFPRDMVPLSTDHCRTLGNGCSLVSVDEEDDEEDDEELDKLVATRRGYKQIRRSIISANLPASIPISGWRLMEPGFEAPLRGVKKMDDGTVKQQDSNDFFCLAVYRKPPYPVSLISVRPRKKQCVADITLAFSTFEEYENAYAAWLVEVEERPSIQRDYYFNMDNVEATCTTFSEKVAILNMRKWNIGYGARFA